MRLIRLFVACCLFIIPCHLHATTPLVAAKPVSLLQADNTTLENMACTLPFGVKAKSISAFKQKEATRQKETAARYSYAEIKCEPNGNVAGEPSYYSYFCPYVAGKWICEKPDFHLIVDIKGNKVDITTTEKIAPTVQSTLKKISHNYRYVNKIPLAQVIGNSCAVSVAASPDEFDFMCAAYFKVSLWCPQPDSSHCPGILSMQNKY